MISDTLVLQNSSPTFPAKPLNADLIFRSRFSMLNKQHGRCHRLGGLERSSPKLNGEPVVQLGFVERLKSGSDPLQLAQLRDNIANKLEVLCRDISEANPHADRYGIGISTDAYI